MSRPRKLVEAAAELHHSKRWLQDWLAKNPVDRFGRPFFSQVGRTRLFEDSDISRILEATKVVPCPSKSLPRVKAKVRTIGSEERTSASLWTEAQALTKGLSPNNSEKPLKPRSNVVSIRKSPSRMPQSS